MPGTEIPPGGDTPTAPPPGRMGDGVAEVITEASQPQGQSSPKQKGIVDRIRELRASPDEKPTSLADKEAESFYGHLKDQKRLDLGWVGKIIGHGVEKLGNIAFIVILVCFGVLVGINWFKTGSDQLAEKTVGQLFSIITLALGYLFGKTTSKQD